VRAHFRPWRPAAAGLASPLAVGLLTALARQGGANATTAGFLYLVLVLGLAAWGGWPAGLVAAVAATVCFNYFFLPPYGTLLVADPANWVALFSFLTAATLASRLVVSARQQAAEADRRRREVEILYELCFGLFTASHRPGNLGEAAAKTLSALGADAGLLVLTPAAGGEPAAPHVIGDGPLPVDAALLAQAQETRETRETAEVGAAGGGRTVYVPLLVGGLLDGVLVARGTAATREVLASAGRLLALAVERERLLAESSHLAAVRESDALKTSLLRAVSHDLRTPLTSMRLAAGGLERHLRPGPEARAALADLAREQERLARRIDNLLALARLEAGLARPHAEDTPPAGLFRAARESLSLVLADRPVEVRVAADCPDLSADPSLTLEIVVNLLENAARAAPAGTPIELAAAADGPGRVRLEVLDRGPGVPPALRQLLGGGRSPLVPADRATDSRSGGLGLQIAASFAAANGGSLALVDRPGGGTIARLTLPAVALPEAA